MSWFVLFSLLFGLVHQGWSRECPVPSTKSALENAQVIFAGRVIAVERDNSPWISRFEVDQVWKGPLSNEQVVITGNGKGSEEGYRFEPGQRYLVVAQQPLSLVQTYSDLCGGTMKYEDAQKILYELGTGTATMKNAALNPLGAMEFTADAPYGWRKVDVPRKFSFFLPPDFHEVKVKGTDSTIGKFGNASMELTYDYGFSSNPLDAQFSSMQGYSDFKEQIVKIGKRVAKLVTYRKNQEQRTAIYFPELAIDAFMGRVKLTMYIQYERPKDLDIAKKIFETIRFVLDERGGERSNTNIDYPNKFFRVCSALRP